MNTETLPYSHEKHLIIAGCLALLSLITAVIYALNSTPYTMVLFLGGGSTLLLAAALLFGWTVWKDLSGRLKSVVTRQFAPGEILFRQGDPAEYVFVITKGRVQAVYTDPAKGEVIVGTLGADEVLGEGAILSRLPRQVTARAADAVEVLAVHRTEFLRLYASLPRLRKRIEGQQAQRKAMLSQPGTTNPGK